MISLKCVRSEFVFKYEKCAQDTVAAETLYLIIMFTFYVFICLQCAIRLFRVDYALYSNRNALWDECNLVKLYFE